MEEKIKEGCTFTTNIDGGLYECYIKISSYSKKNYPGDLTILHYMHISKLVKKKFLFFTYTSHEWYHEYMFHYRQIFTNKADINCEVINGQRYYTVQDAKRWAEEALKDYKEKQEIEKQAKVKAANIVHKEQI